MSDDNDPNNWRNAIDPSTGQTYWYHRITRQSTWIMPLCFCEEPFHEGNAYSISSHHETDDYEENSDNIETSDTLESLLNYPVRAAGFSETVSEELERISALVTIVTHSKSVESRLLGLSDLWTLTLDRKAVVEEHFHTNQSWVPIIEYLDSWKDPESVLLLASILCNLSIGRHTQVLVTQGTKNSVLSRLNEIYSQNQSFNLEVLLKPPQVQASESSSSRPLREACVLGERLMHSYDCLVSRGHEMPAMLIVVAMQRALRFEQHCVSLVKNGALMALQSICACRQIGDLTRDRARNCLLGAMGCCPYARERLLDSYLGLTADLQHIADASGPSPAAALHFVSDDDEAQRARQDEIDLGRYDIPCEMELNSLPSMQRDVEWIPTSGTAWRLSSIILWTRCPALRDLIAGFWEEGGGGLELSIRASDEVLSSLVRFIHSGYVVLPRTLSLRLELLRVAEELEMIQLGSVALAEVMQSLDREGAAVALRYAIDNELQALEQQCDSFLRSGLRRLPELVKFELPRNGQNANISSDSWQVDSTNNVSLRDAIFASLQDVSAALSEPSPVKWTTAPYPNDTCKLHLLEASKLSSGGSVLHRDEFADPTWSSQYGGEELDQVDLRGHPPKAFELGSDEASDWAHDGHLRSHIVRKSDASNGKDRSGNASGGIYGLLLRQGDGAAGKPPMARSGVPGRVMPDRTHRGTTGFGGGVPRQSAGSDKKSASKTGHTPDTTPRTKRATNILASARPSAGHEDASNHSFSRLVATDDVYSDCDDLVAAGFSSTEHVVGGPVELREYEAGMSLEPPRERSAAELKLINMSKPRKVVPKKRTGRKLASAEAEDAVDDPDGLPSAAEVRVDAKEVPLPEKENHGALSIPSKKLDGKVLAVPKRAISPPVAALRPSTAAPGELSATETVHSSAGEHTVAHDVRGSLTLLKNRANRRRRSVAEVDIQTRSTDEPSATTTATVDFSAQLRDKQQPKRTEPIDSGGVQNRDADSVLTGQQSSAPESGEQFKNLVGPGHSYQQQKRPPEVHSNYEEESDGAEQASSHFPTHECPDCGRHFAELPFQKHIKVCKKVFVQKRKTFDSAKMRSVEGVAELQTTGTKRNKKGKKEAMPEPAAAPPNKWREQSGSFREAMKAARAVKHAQESGAPLPAVAPSAPDSSLIQCPHCSRRFNDKAAERHIASCQNIRAKPSSLKKGSGVNASSGNFTPSRNSASKGRW